MTTVTVSNKLTEILASFGDLQESVNTAVQRYTIEQITNKITELRRKDEEFQKEYGMDYSAFAERTGEDEEFVNKVEADISKTWEADLADWEFCHHGVEDWTTKLQDILPNDEITLLSEAALAEDWLNPEEDKAWSHLQQSSS